MARWAVECSSALRASPAPALASAGRPSSRRAFRRGSGPDRAVEPGWEETRRGLLQWRFIGEYADTSLLPDRPGLDTELL